MASSALEEKINKIRQRNEEIRRRYEEVEEDKKNAARLNALVQMVPSKDWPERKEPPEFSNPPRVSNKPKSSSKEHSEHVQQHHHDEKKVHTFAQGEGPPPDPKYNFLADAEREGTTTERDNNRENMSGRNYNRPSRGSFRKRGTGRENVYKDNRSYQKTYRDDHQPEYEAWRAERNRIDEDRISRQRTAEGNWRREWDNDKAHIVDDVIKNETRGTVGDFVKRNHKDFDKRHHYNSNEYSVHNRGNHRPHRGMPRSFHNNYDNRPNMHDQHGHVSSGNVASSLEERTVVATDKSIKVTLNQGNAKGPVMSVKVNSPTIAGTGRVGPRQRTRVTYSSHSDVEVTPEVETFSRQKSFEDKSKEKGSYYNNAQKSPNLRRPQMQKKKDNNSKSPYMQRREVKRDEGSSKYYDNESKSTYPRKEYRSPQKPYSPKSPKAPRRNIKPMKSVDGAEQLKQDEPVTNVKEQSDTESNANAEKDSSANDLPDANSEFIPTDTKENETHLQDEIETTDETNKEINSDAQCTDPIIEKENITENTVESTSITESENSLTKTDVAPITSVEDNPSKTNTNNDITQDQSRSLEKELNNSDNLPNNEAATGEADTDIQLEQSEKTEQHESEENPDKDNTEKQSEESTTDMLNDNCDTGKEVTINKEEDNLDKDVKIEGCNEVAENSESKTCSVIEDSNKLDSTDDTVIKEKSPILKENETAEESVEGSNNEITVTTSDDKKQEHIFDEKEDKCNADANNTPSDKPLSPNVDNDTLTEKKQKEDTETAMN